MGLKNFFSGFFKKEEDPEYIEIDLGPEPKKSKVLVRPFILKKFDDVPEILNSLREGYTIAVIDMRPLREKDVIELKRAVAKLKKTAEALEGSITGFGENTVIVAPNFAEIYKPGKQPSMQNLNPSVNPNEASKDLL